MIRSIATSLVCLTALALPTSAADKPKVMLETSMGNITIELDPEKAPKTVENFLGYTSAKYYDGTIFHRVIEDFMIQGGGFTADMIEKPTAPPVKNESGNGLSNVKGSIAMARTNNPDSATSQFFINTGNNTRLDTAGGGYTVFGKVVEGMDVVEKIRKVATETKFAGGQALEDVPKTPVVIKSARVVK